MGPLAQTTAPQASPCLNATTQVEAPPQRNKHPPSPRQDPPKGPGSVPWTAICCVGARSGLPVLRWGRLCAGLGRARGGAAGPREDDGPGRAAGAGPAARTEGPPRIATSRGGGPPDRNRAGRQAGAGTDVQALAGSLDALALAAVAKEGDPSARCCESAGPLRAAERRRASVQDCWAGGARLASADPLQKPAPLSAGAGQLLNQNQGPCLARSRVMGNLRAWTRYAAMRTIDLETWPGRRPVGVWVACSRCRCWRITLQKKNPT
jgi:hypothetical protein